MAIRIGSHMMGEQGFSAAQKVARENEAKRSESPALSSRGWKIPSEPDFLEIWRERVALATRRLEKIREQPI